MMRILEVATNAWHEVTIEEISPKDIRTLFRKRYFFDWREVVGKAKVYKLTISGNNDIKGLMSLTDFLTECIIEINLLTASRENVVFDPEKGKKQKEFYGIIGNLIAFAAKLAIAKYGQNACVSLIPKTALKNHYIKEYGMKDGGWQVYLEFEQLNNLIEKYKL